MIKKYENQIFQIMNIFKDEKFLERRLQVYNTKPNMLNPLEIYVIEEIYRLGNNNYFKTLAKIERKDIVEEYNTFMEKCRKNFDYKLYKTKEFFKNNNDLTDLEKFCISLIWKNNEEKEILDKRMKYQYDDLFELKYSTDEEIKETMANVALSVGINAILKIDDAITKGIKERQLSKGVFADVDKKYLINLIRENPGNRKSIEELVNKVFPMVKNFIDENNGNEILSNFYFVNVEDHVTNITAKEVFNLKKDKTI